MECPGVLIQRGLVPWGLVQLAFDAVQDRLPDPLERFVDRFHGVGLNCRDRSYTHFAARVAVDHAALLGGRHERYF